MTAITDGIAALSADLAASAAMVIPAGFAIVVIPMGIRYLMRVFAKFGASK